MRSLKLRCKCGTIIASVDSKMDVKTDFGIKYFEYFFVNGSINESIMCMNCGERYDRSLILEVVKMRLNRWEHERNV